MAKRSTRHHSHNQPRHRTRRARKYLGRPWRELTLQERMELSLEAYRRRERARNRERE